ncbi:MAG: hypothetical protein QW734_03770 [Candidatus Bathyarchaeia archaeon]
MAVDIVGLVTTVVGVGLGVALIGGIASRVPTTFGKYLTALALSVGALFFSERIKDTRINQLVKGIGIGGISLIAIQLLRKTPLLFPFMMGLVPPTELTPEEEELLGVPPRELPEERLLAEELASVPPEYVQRAEEMPPIVL